MNSLFFGIGWTPFCLTRLNRCNLAVNIALHKVFPLWSPCGARTCVVPTNAPVISKLRDIEPPRSSDRRSRSAVICVPDAADAACRGPMTQEALAQAVGRSVPLGRQPVLDH